MATAPILAGDIKLLASKIMDDVPNGGGGPTGNAIPDGASNAVFSDVTERQRAVGGVSIRQLFGAVQTPTTDAYMDPTVVLSQLPNDPNVSITLAKTSMFAKRTEIANAIENYLISSSAWQGYLFENHVAGQRSIQLFQRPGTPQPTVGRTLVLVENEGLPGQAVQFVRVTRAETETRTFTEISNGAAVDFKADLVTCDLTDVLRSNFAGSPPSRAFTRVTGKANVRDTTVADAATFYGASALTAAGHIGESLLRVSSVYTQLVPSARTESAALDQKPAAQRTLTLAQSPRLIEVGITPHTMRIRVGQENRGFSWVQMLKPRPAPGTIVISYMALGNWYTLVDDGLGGFTGSGVGQVIYTTGSLSITLPSIPDAGTSIIFQWGENTAYTSRAGQAGFRAPEFAWALPHQGIKPGNVVVTWLSGGVLKTAIDNGQGAFTSASATGEIDYATGKIYLRPTAMIDAGGEFQAAYEYTSTRTENFAGIAPDSGGFASITLAEAPAPKSIAVRWITTRTVSASSGTSSIVSASANGAEVKTVVVDPPQPSGNFFSASTYYTMPGNEVSFSGQVAAPQTPGTYTWEVVGTPDPSLVVQGGATSGTFEMSAPPPGGLSSGGSGGTVSQALRASANGSFSLTIAATCPDLGFNLRIKNQALTLVADAGFIYVDALGDKPGPAWPTPPPPPVIVVPEDPVVPTAPLPYMAHGGWLAENGVRVYVEVPRTQLAADSIYADADGMGYDLPGTPPPGNMTDEWLWTASDIAAGRKTLKSVAGIATQYKQWRA